jgi:hypothetical protein
VFIVSSGDFENHSTLHFTSHCQRTTYGRNVFACAKMRVLSGGWIMRIRLMSVLVSALLLAACAGYTRIGDIVAAPGQFEGKEVQLKGTVTGALQVPVIELRGYTLRDDTGEIAVVTTENVPAPQQAVAMSGIVRSLAIIGGQSLGLRIEETRRH